MNSRYTSLFRFFFVCVDLLALYLVQLFFLTFIHRIPASAEPKYLLLFVVSSMLWLLSGYFTALYTHQGKPDFEQFIKRTVRALTVFFVAMVVFMFFYHYPFSRLFVLLSFVAFGTLLLSIRTVTLGILWYADRRGGASKRIIIVGFNDVARQLTRKFSARSSNTLVEGYFEDQGIVDQLSTLPIIGNIDECVSYAVENNINEIYSTISPEMNTSLYEMAHTAEKSLIRFKFVPDFRFYINRNTHMEYIDGMPILSLRPEPLEDSSNAMKKRLFDIVFSLLVIAFVLSWLMPIIAILIKLNSPGPVFFVQERSGKDNRLFKCFKFRTLAVNKEANTQQVIRDDKRITTLGKFLRKSNLDELPQFFNVLLGNMSVVGPRPHMLAHTETYSRLLEEYMVRHFVKPGVTGWAQVNGFRGEIRGQEQLRNRIGHDIWYMENWSLWLDLKVIFLTVYTTIRGDKNAF